MTNLKIKSQLRPSSKRGKKAITWNNIIFGKFEIPMSFGLNSKNIHLNDLRFIKVFTGKIFSFKIKSEIKLLTGP